MGRFFRGMSEYNSADAYFDDWSHRPALVRDMDSRAGGLDADAIRKKCLDEATGKVDEDKYRQEIINGLKGNWREQRQNFEEYQNSLVKTWHHADETVKTVQTFDELGHAHRQYGLTERNMGFHQHNFVTTNTKKGNKPIREPNPRHRTVDEE